MSVNSNIYKLWPIVVFVVTLILGGYLFPTRIEVNTKIEYHEKMHLEQLKEINRRLERIENFMDRRER